MTYIKIDDGTKYYGQDLVFKNLDLKIDKPGIYIISGPSGCGKTTLLYTIAGLEKLTSGAIKRQGSSTMIFQNYELIDEFTIFENIFFKSAKKATKEDHKLINTLKIDEFKDRKIKQLSFGQRQRVGIARALAQRPDIILCDEPTESLDIQNKLIVMDALKEYSQDHIVIIVSHDRELIERYYDVIYGYEGDTFIKKADRRIDRSMAQRSKVKHKTLRLSFKMVYKRTLLLALFMLIMTISIFSIYCYKRKIFVVPDTKDTLNADYIYIDTVSDLRTIKETYATSAQVILNIKYIDGPNGKERIDVFPYHADERFVIEGDIPDKDNVIINQRSDLAIGDEIVLKIKYRTNEYDYKVKVSGMIDEKDALSQVIYYDLDAILDALADIKIDDTDLKELILDYPEQFEAKVGYERIAKLSKYSIIRSPLYDLRTIMIDDSSLYDVIFSIITILMIVFSFIIVLIFDRYDIKKINYNILIFKSLGISSKKVKRQCILIKDVIVVLICLLSTLVCYLIKNEIFSDLRFALFEYLVCMFLIFALCLLYVIQIYTGISFDHFRSSTLKRSNN